MSEVRKLHAVAPPTSSEVVRADMIEKLERTLTEAKRGEVEELFMIVRHPNKEYSDRATPTEDLPSWIGRLTIIKQRWINVSLEYEDERIG